MSDAPENVWVEMGLFGDGSCFDAAEYDRQGTGYIRADLYEALQAENARLREAHQENARILGFLENELQGRVEVGKLAALSKCADRSRAALSDQPRQHMPEGEHGDDQPRNQE